MTYDNIKSHKKTLFRRQILIFGKVIGRGGGVHKPPSRFRVNFDLVLKNFFMQNFIEIIFNYIARKNYFGLHFHYVLT